MSFGNPLEKHISSNSNQIYLNKLIKVSKITIKLRAGVSRDPELPSPAFMAELT